MTIAKELKKLVARVTGISDPSSIIAETIGDVFAYAATNMNVNSDGRLVITDIVEGGGSSSGGNLLSEPIVVTEANYEVDEGRPMFLTNIPTLGVEIGKKYKVAITYNGTQNEFNCTAQDIAVADGAIVLQPDNSEMPYITFENTSVVIFDKVWFSNGVQSQPEYSDEYGSIQATTADGTNPMSLPFSIDSIVEVEASAKPIVTFSAEDSDTYDESMGMYIKTLDTPVDTSAFAHNTKVKLNFSVNGEAMSAEGYMIKETDSEGTYCEYISMRSAEDGGGAIFALVYDEANQKGVALMNYFNMNALTEQAGATFGFQILGYDPLPTIEILNITEVA